jgi:integrase/recombinase XerD
MKSHSRSAHRRPFATQKPKLPALRLDLAIDEYERDLCRGRLSEKTVRNYGQILRLADRFLEELLGRPPTLDDFTLRQAEAFQDHLIARGKLPSSRRYDTGPVLSTESIRTYLRALKVFSSWLAAPKQRYTDENRLELLPLPKKEETFKLPLELHEVQALLDACDTLTVWGSRDLAILLTYLDGGLRAMEMAHLQVGQVNLETGTLFISSGKGNKSRTVTIGDHTKRMLRRYAFLRDASTGHKAEADTPFFRNKHDRAFGYEGLRVLLRRIKRQAGVERAFLHLLRHTSAVRTLEVPGSDLITLQEKLGHADIATTRRYIRMTTATLSQRQRAFSPIDHLQPKGLMRLVPPDARDLHFYRKRSALPARVVTPLPPDLQPAPTESQQSQEPQA